VCNKGQDIRELVIRIDGLELLGRVPYVTTKLPVIGQIAPHGNFAFRGRLKNEISFGDFFSQNPRRLSPTKSLKSGAFPLFSSSSL
jgi:hypothetical protein